MPRTTTGCWTCRARKKRCDDRRPECAACMLRSVKCYGYDDKPAWMDGGEVEEVTMRVIKLQVKESYRRRRSRITTCLSGPLKDDYGQQAVSVSPLASIHFRALVPRAAQPEPTGLPESPSLDSSPRDQHAASPSISESGSVQVPWEVCSDEPSYMDSVPARDTRFHHRRTEPENLLTVCPRSGFGPAYSYSEREINLIMYFLDHIFHRINPYFRYSAADNGRGWMLNIFLRTKPLCTAVACLSVCDQAQYHLGPLTDLAKIPTELELQYLQSVMDLRDHLHRLSNIRDASQVRAGVEALACIILLLMFQLWIPRNGTLDNDWPLHLDAASSLLASLDVAPSLFDSSGKTTSTGSQFEGLANKSDNISSLEILPESERSAFEWFLTVYAYLMINAVATLGFTSKTLESVPRIRAIFHNGQHKLRDLLGYADWVLITILDISVLNHWKQQMTAAGTLSVKELAKRADSIEAQLNGGLDAAAMLQTSLRSFNERQKHMITNLYINAALVFLHVVVSGFYPAIPEIHRSVTQTLHALEYMDEHSPLYFPVWPYCVAGCLAQEEQYPQFRRLVPVHREGQHSPVLARWTLEIIEECWKTRSSQSEGGKSCSWATAMSQLKFKLLLI